MRWKTLAVLLAAVVIAGTVGSAADLSRVKSLVEDGRPAEALSDLDEHLVESPADPEALFLRALLLASTQRQDEAGEAFEELSGLRPDRPEPLNNLAVIQAANGNYDEAVETLKEALRTHPAYRTAYENLTKIYGQLASEAYSRALSVDQVQDRSSLELILLSEMILPELETRIAEAPAEPLPSVEAGTQLVERMEPERDSDEAAEVARATDTAEAPEEAAVHPQTPDQAIEQALQDGRDPGQVAGEPRVDPAPEASAAPEAEMAETEETMPAAPALPLEPRELAEVVEAWARAWSEQRVDDYISFYGRDFQPAHDLSRADWESYRRERVAAPEFVRVSVAFLDFDSTQADRALVRFNQSYESDTFSDVVTKTLEFVRQDGDWKIARESVDS